MSRVQRIEIHENLDRVEPVAIIAVIGCNASQDLDCLVGEKRQTGGGAHLSCPILVIQGGNRWYPFGPQGKKGAYVGDMHRIYMRSRRYPGST